MRLNYQHLLYFWTVVRAGSLTRACEKLNLSVPTDMGRMVYRYADGIFSLGREMVDTLKGRPQPPGGRPRHA